MLETSPEQLKIAPLALCMEGSRKLVHANCNCYKRSHKNGFPLGSVQIPLKEGYVSPNAHCI